MKRGDDTGLYIRHILMSCSSRSMSVKELSETCGIPIGICYNIVRKLLSKGVLKCSLNLNNNRVVPLFKSRLGYNSTAFKKYMKEIA